MVWRNAAILLIVLVGISILFWERTRMVDPYRTGATGQIAFVSNREGTFSLWQVDASTTLIRPLLRAQGERIMLHPIFSPNGRWIAYTSAGCSSCFNEIFVVGASGRRAIHLSQFTGEGNYEDPQWSPDSNWLALVRADLSSGERDLLLIKRDGSEFRTLTDTDDVDEIEPAWSADGRQIAYVRATVGQRQIWLMDVATGDTRPLTPQQDYAISPAWSPDGNQIVFSSRHAGSSLDLWVMRPDGTQMQRLTTDDPDELAPVWSPDGSRIAYQSSFEQDDSRIMVLELAENHIHDLTAGRGHAFAPVWSPDGAWLAFTLANDIVMVPMTGGELIRLTNNPLWDQFPAWQPFQTE